MISHVKHVSIPVKDQDRALKFYTDKLGFKVTTDVDFGQSQRWIVLDAPEGQTQVVLFTMEGHEDRIGDFQNIVFASKDVNKSYAELKAKGVEFTTPPTEEDWGTYVMFQDSEGNTFVLSTSRD